MERKGICGREKRIRGREADTSCTCESGRVDKERPDGMPDALKNSVKGDDEVVVGRWMGAGAPGGGAKME